MADHAADSWRVVHDNPNPGPENVPEYMFGPLPSKEVADLISAASECECKTRVIPLFFPNGVKMVMVVPLPATDTPTDDLVN